MAKAAATKEIKPVQIHEKRATFHILGITPLIYNSANLHVMADMLLPPERITQAEKGVFLKHDVYREYKQSTYARRDMETGPTRLLLPCRMFKRAMQEAAKRVPGAKGTEIAQLVWVQQEYTDLFGFPMLRMDWVRNTDIKRTPDVRTRATCPEWYCCIAITFVTPQINIDAIGTLLSAAGKICGVGDYRQQKGYGNYGQFELVNENDPRIAAIKKNGLKQQDQGLADPTPYDRVTETLLEFYNEEAPRRGLRKRTERISPNGGQVEA